MACSGCRKGERGGRKEKDDKYDVTMRYILHYAYIHTTAEGDGNRSA